MSFENAPVTKGLMMAWAFTSLVGGVFDVKHYLNVQLVPHISRHHQYWRLVAQNAAFANSSDLLVAEFLLFNAGIHVERMFGTCKFASFAVVTMLMSTLMEFLGLLIFHHVGLNFIPGGPIPLIFAIIYQWFRLVPSAYEFRIFGVALSNKIYTYVLVAQIAFGNLPGSLAASLVGLVAGVIYRSDMVNLKHWRVSPAVARFSRKFILPLLGSMRPPRRLTRAVPAARVSPQSTDSSFVNEEVITTARPAPPPTTRNRGSGEGSVVRGWVNELTGRGDNAAAETHVPNESEISQLTSMFPDIQRDVIVAALQRRCGFLHVYLSTVD
ncbi:hypothetical protein CONPUDRAFT_64722 [Coniophora puteana RWD-64-598 SS2]|uniref:CUE domain-containing protein n=1 Tax=Coniophora puteana (strain RWD-64-598) TaxID=741705 RepID=A0A5M3MAD9_CONPW|nr:uncharacterized protein CONPUDRAFT_64722 [Coniophora puteana RWD-64-598 SS2]EIW76228.1 hypothetical protein CONPUDRAFT_64722 [Coniophora puteana RWD-64-598 SS2]